MGGGPGVAASSPWVYLQDVLNSKEEKRREKKKREEREEKRNPGAKPPHTTQSPPSPGGIENLGGASVARADPIDLSESVYCVVGRSHRSLRDLWESPVPAMAYLRASGLFSQTVWGTSTTTTTPFMGGGS